MRARRRGGTDGDGGGDGAARGHRPGLEGAGLQAAATQVKALAPLDIINDQLIPALDQVGQGFEKGTLFLPQLLMTRRQPRRPSKLSRRIWTRRDSRR